MTLKRFTLGMGIFLLALGVLGFFPFLIVETMMPDDGLLFGVFAVNWLHNIVHMAFGVWGIVASKDILSSKTFCKVTALVFAVVVILGLIPTLNTLYGIMPLYGHNIWLNTLIALSTGYFGYVWGTHKPMVPTH